MEHFGKNFIDKVRMATSDSQRTINKATGAIASVIGLMLSTFALFSVVLPSSLAQPIGALVIGLILTAILVWMGRWTWGIALPTWLAVGFGVLVVYLIISRPVSLTGSVMKNDSSGGAAGLQLVLTDSGGVEHKSVTDEDGNFEISNIPQGKYTILTISGDLIYSGVVPSGWERLFRSYVTVGQLPYKPADLPLPTPTVTPLPAPTMNAVPSPLKPEIEVIRLHIPFSLPGTNPDPELPIPIPRRIHIIVRTNLVEDSNQYLWMFVCKRMDQGDIPCNISRSDLNRSGDWDEYVNIGKLGPEDDCASFEVGFAIIDGQTNNLLDHFESTITHDRLPDEEFLAVQWFLVRRQLQEDGSSLLPGCLATPASST